MENIVLDLATNKRTILIAEKSANYPSMKSKNLEM